MLTPFPILPLCIPRALDDIVPQDTGRLERMLDLHGCVDGGAFVGVELFAGFGAGGVEDSVVIYFMSFQAVSYGLWIVGVRDGWCVVWTNL